MSTLIFRIEILGFVANVGVSGWVRGSPGCSCYVIKPRVGELCDKSTDLPFKPMDKDR